MDFSYIQGHFHCWSKYHRGRRSFASYSNKELNLNIVLWGRRYIWHNSFDCSYNTDYGIIFISHVYPAFGSNFSILFSDSKNLCQFCIFFIKCIWSLFWNNFANLKSNFFNKIISTTFFTQLSSTVFCYFINHLNLNWRPQNILLI